MKTIWNEQNEWENCCHMNGWDEIKTYNEFKLLTMDGANLNL